MKHLISYEDFRVNESSNDLKRRGNSFYFYDVKNAEIAKKALNKIEHQIEHYVEFYFKNRTDLYNAIELVSSKIDKSKEPNGEWDADDEL